MDFAIIQTSEGKKQLAKINGHHYLIIGETVACRAPSGYESFCTVCSSDFSADEAASTKLMKLWNVTPDCIKTIVAVLHRQDFDEEETGLPDIPEIEV